MPAASLPGSLVVPDALQCRSAPPDAKALASFPLGGASRVATGARITPPAAATAATIGRAFPRAGFGAPFQGVVSEYASAAVGASKPPLFHPKSLIGGGYPTKLQSFHRQHREESSFATLMNVRVRNTSEESALGVVIYQQAALTFRSRAGVLSARWERSAESDGPRINVSNISAVFHC